MDPTANLREQVEIARAIIETVDATAEEIGGMSDEDRHQNEDRGERLAELVLVLDGWRRTSDFDPYRDATPEPRELVLDALSALGVTVTVTRSAASDQAPVVFVDTSDELEGEHGPRIRIHLNDAPVYVGVALGEEAAS